MPPSEHELRLRDRLSRLRNMSLLGGAKLSGELQRLQRQLDRIGEDPTGDDIWRSVELARHPERPYTLACGGAPPADWFAPHGARSRGGVASILPGLGPLAGRAAGLAGRQQRRAVPARPRRPSG